MTFVLGLEAVAQPLFREAASEVGIAHTHKSGSLYGPGVAAVDFDLDGDLDIYLIEDQLGNHLYRNDGGELVQVAEQYGLNLRPQGNTDPQHPSVQDVGGMSPAFVDLDNDGDRDFFLSMWREPSRMFWLQDGQYVEVPAGPFQVVGNTTGAAFGDYDRDRNLDLYLVYWGEHDRLLRGSPGGRGFSDVSEASGIWDIPNPMRAGWSAVWFYHDDDMSPELYVLNDYTLPNFCYWNTGTTFVARENNWFVPEHNAGASMGFALGDYDRDGDEDLYIANTPPNNDFYRREHNTFTNLMYTGDASARVLKDANIGWHTDWFDIENDGWLDLFLVNGYIALCAPGISAFPYGCSPASVWRQPNRLWSNHGATFTDVSASAGIQDFNFGRAGARGDYDLDGDVDLIVTNNNGPTRFYWNETPDIGHWIAIRFTGTTSNREAFGARVTVRSGAVVQERLYASTGGFLSQPGDEIYFGLADATVIDELRVLWPSGREDAYSGLPVDRRIHLLEGADAEAVAALATPPQLGLQQSATGMLLTISLADQGYQRLRVHRARPGRFSGVVAEFDAGGRTRIEWVDGSVELGQAYRYRVEAERNGNWTMSDPAQATTQSFLAAGPGSLSASPNPFSPGQTALRYQLPGAENRRIELRIFDVSGRCVRRLESGPRPSGPHSANWDGRDDQGRALGSGVYFARLNVDGLGEFSTKLTLRR